MFARKATALAVAGLATVALAMGPATAGYQASGRYVAGTAGGNLPHSGPSFTVGGPNIGGVWFAVPAGATQLDASVIDDYSDAVAADIVFVIDEYGPLAQSKRFCSSAKAIPIPAGTKALYVRLKSLNSLACSPQGVPTTGTAFVTFG
ncbi:MAG: hypothetical protein ACRDKS_11570 [Actinomycetota bacterium]